MVFLTRKDPPGKPLPNRADRWRGQDSGPFTMEQVPLRDTSGKFASPYGDRARNGATIFPRSLFMVNVEQTKTLVQATNILTVSPRRSKQEKNPWKQLELPELANQAIEAEHVFDVHLGETVAPYVLLEPLKAVLPLSKSTGELVKKESGWYGIDPLSLGQRMRRRWQIVNKLWDEHKNTNNKLGMLGRLDYFGNLRAQEAMNFNGKSYVVYPQSGRPTAAIVSNPSIIDYRLFWIECTLDEAKYLTAIINSTELETQVEPLMSKGQFGARDLEKHLWRLPIPEYDESNDLHQEIAAAGASAAEAAKTVLAEVRAEREASGKSFSVTIARRELRRWLSESEEGQRVEALVGRLLG